MAISPDAVLACVVALLIQAGASIFFAGSLAFAVKSHDKRLDVNEQRTTDLATEVAEIKGSIAHVSHYRD